MRSLTLFLAGLASAANVSEIPSWARPKFPVSTIDNDGTHAGRYDVRKTMVWLDEENPENLNSYCYFYWVTTTCGRKFHTMLAPNFFRGATTGIFRVEDMDNLTSTGATTFAPGTGSTEFLNFQSEIQNLTSPRGGDNFTDVHISADYAGVKMDVQMTPTGKNLYIGGAGGVTISPKTGTDANQNDYSTLIPGYSWYWGNPTLKLEGTITVDGEELEIDADESRGYFERQWGEFGIAGGHYGYWLYLSNGILVHGWVVGPTLEQPFGYPAWATIWHPNGIHEVLEVDNTTKGLNAWKSEASGNNYFQDVELNMSQRNASFNIHQVIKNGEISPLPGTQGYNISEAYAQGDGIWEGKPVTFYGHLEQLSYW